jgi:hypothetical protein
MNTPFAIRLSGPITDVVPLPTPSQLAGQGAEQAASHAAHLTKSDWKGIALAFLRGFAKHRATFQCSDARTESAGVVPDHPNADKRAWGAVIQAAAKEGWIKPTGRFEKTNRLESHGRPECVWTFVEART